MEFLIYLFLLFYFLYTLSFALKFNKTDVFYTKKQRLTHNIMIWVIPFIWIIILKALDKPMRRHAFKKQTVSSTNDGDAGWWALGFYALFHSSGHSPHDGQSGHESGGYDSHGGQDYDGSDSTGYSGEDHGGGGDCGH